MHGDEGMINFFQRKKLNITGVGKKETIQKNVVKIDEKVLDKINKHISNNPFEFYPICELANVNKWYSTEWANLQEELRTPIYYPPDFVHRKTWEWIQLIYGLEKLGVLNETSMGLGIGTGHESPMYYFSNKVRKVIGTDLYDENSIWMTNAKEGNPEILTDIDKFAPFPYRKDRLEIKRMDGRKLEFPGNTFDFVWSCSSIEHFGGHEEAAKSMREMERVLKPDGILALATEFLIDQNIIPGLKADHSDFFNAKNLYEYLIASHNLKLVQKIDFSMDEYYVKNHIKLPEESQSPHKIEHRKPHIVLCQDKVLFTSIFMFFRKE
jgi:SAM-dependent methyltransferase